MDVSQLPNLTRDCSFGILAVTVGGKQGETSQDFAGRCELFANEQPLD